MDVNMHTPSTDHIPSSYNESTAPSQLDLILAKLSKLDNIKLHLTILDS